MLPEPGWRGALIACLVILPASVRLWTGRSLARSADDAALGERLLATQRINSLALVFSIALLFVISRRWWLWLPMLVAYTAAAYPLRRSLYEETWSLGGYLSFTGRLLLGSVGFWIVLALAPAIVWSAGMRDWIAAAILGTLLFVWQAWQGELLRGLVRTRPLENPVLRPRFEGLARRCGIPVPRFEQVDLHGGVIANAVALASTRGSAVVFTDTLLARLEPDESAAICAHELAHIEHFTPQRLRRIALVTSAFIVAGVSLPVIARLADLHALIMWVSWGTALLLALMWLARDRQRNETSSDLRAVAITGDGEALVRALTKGYTISRMPRRLHPQYERQATHPSLARRIRDIRRAAGATPATLAAETRLMAPDASTSVTFGAGHLNWQEGEAALHSLSYAHLSELRVHPKRDGCATLVAVERSGRRWEMPLLDVDVARAQAVLDIVDERLSDALPRSSVWPRVSRVLAALLALLTLPLGSISAVLVAVLAFVRPASALIGAAGASGLTAAILALRGEGIGGNTLAISFGILSGTVGVSLLIAATATLREAATSGAREPRWGSWLMVMGFFAIASVALVLTQASSVVRLHLWARAIQSAAVLPIACAGALAFSRPRSWIGAAVAGAIGLGAFSAGSVVFLDAFGRDTLLVSAPLLRQTVLTNAPRSELSLDFAASDLRLSTTGR